MSSTSTDKILDTQTTAKTQLLVPIYNEGENVLKLYQELVAAKVEFDELKFVYDYDGDSTLPFIAELQQKDGRVVADKNCFGRGVINALTWGFAHCSPGPVIVIMGDNSDKLEVIPAMVELWKNGTSVVCPSRYMKGGKQHGGGLIKSNMSRIACISLRLLGFPTTDATNNFKLYDGAWLKKQKIESIGGFEVAIELCYLAYMQGLVINELPSEWRDRTQGKSNFKLMAWTPKYLYWYLKILAEIIKKKISS
ncbi:MAG: glycosyltransferase [Proteobacteria bacterium]|nr:glycosyltransferase [Pseudomonadota bacterium]